MRDHELVVLEMERQGKRLHGLLRVGRLNSMTREEFQEMLHIVGRLRVNLTDFNVLHFGPDWKIITAISDRKPPKRAKGIDETGRADAKNRSTRTVAYATTRKAQRE